MFRFIRIGWFHRRVCVTCVAVVKMWSHLGRLCTLCTFYVVLQVQNPLTIREELAVVCFALQPSGKSAIQ